MEYNLWKSVLLDWVNSTGFLVQNYENLGDTNIDTFFIAFKNQIKSTQIKSEDVLNFVRDYYKDFFVKLTETGNVAVSEYVYIYSLFLHFSCVLHADIGIQQICNSMVRKNQEVIEKFLDYVFKIGKCDRIIVQSAIEEAEDCDFNTDNHSPITRNLQSLISNTSPQTPKSRMLNTWNLANRNLQAKLDTERFERGYLEMQLNQCEKKLSKLDDDYKEAMVQNNRLKKQIQSLDEHDQLAQNTVSDQTVKQLRREIDEKENEILKMTIGWNEAKDDIETLKEKLQYAESQIKSLNLKLHESFSEAETFKSQLDEREKMINYMNNNNKELSDLLKELQSSTKRHDFDSTTSSEMLNCTANDLNTSSFCIPEENLANAVIDIRLLDQQKQNVTLNESIVRLQNELSVVQTEAFKLYRAMGKSDEGLVEQLSPNLVFSAIQKKYTETVQKNHNLSEKIDSHCSEIVSLKGQTSGLQSTIDGLNEKLQLEAKEIEDLIRQSQNKVLELENIKTALTRCEKEREELNASLLEITARIELIQSEKQELIAKHSGEVRDIQTELEVANASLEIQINEKDGIQSKLDHVQHELDETMAVLAKYKLDLDQITNELSEEKAAKDKIEKEYSSAKTQCAEINQKLEEAQKDFNVVLVRMEETHKEKIDKYQNEIDSHCSEIATLKEQTSGLQSTINALNEKLQLEAKENENLISQNQNTVVELNNNKAALTKCEKEREELNASLLEITARIELIQSEKQDQIAKHSGEMRDIQTELEGKLNFANANLEIQINEKNGIQSELDHAKHELDETMAVLAKYKLDLDQITNELSEEKAAKDKIEKDRSSAKTQCAEITQKLEEAQKDFNVVLVRMEETHKEKIAQWNKDKESLLNQYQNAVVELDDIKVALTKCERERAELNASLLEVRQRIELTESEKQELIAKHSSEVHDIQTELGVANASLEMQINEKNGIQSKLDHTQHELDETSAILAKYKLDLDQIMSELSAEKAAKENIEKEYSSAKTQCAEISQKLEEAQKDFNETLVRMEETHKENIEQYQKKVDSHCSEIATLKEQTNELQRTINVLNEKLQLEAKESENLISENQNSVVELDNIKAALTKCEKEREELNASLLKATASIEQIQSEKQELGAKYFSEVRNIQTELEEKLNIANASLEVQFNQKTGIQSELDNAQRELDETTATLAKYKSDLEQITSELSDEKAATENIEKDCSSAKTQYTEISEKLEKAQKDFNESLVRMEETQKEKIEQWNKEKESLLNQYQNSKKEIDIYCSEIASLKEQTTGLQSTIDALNEKKQFEAKKNENLVSQNQNSQKEIESHCSEIATLKEQTVELQSTINALNEKLQLESKENENWICQNKNAVVELEKIKAAKIKCEKEREELNASLLEVTARIELIQSEKKELIAKHSGEMRDIQTELEVANASLEIQTNEKDGIQSKLDHAQHELDETTAILAKYKSDLDQITSELSEEKAAKENIERDCSSTETRCTEITQKLEEAQKKLSAAQLKIDEIISEKVTLGENLKSMTVKSEEATKTLEAIQNDLANVNTEKNSLVTKIIQLNRTIDEVTQQMSQEKDQFDEKQKEINEELLLVQMDRDSMQQKLRTIENESAEKRKEFDALVQEKEGLENKIDQHNKDIEEMADSLTRLRGENKALIESSTNKEQLLVLNEQLVRMEKTHNEKIDLWKKERESLITDVKICRAKLMKERETSELKEKEYKIMRNNFEEKLEKMKERMKTLYKEEMAKVQDKHEQQLNDLITENRRLMDKLVKYDERTKEFASQIHALNEEKLMLLKEHEIMKSKLRTIEIDSTLNRGNGATSSSTYFDKIRGANFRMEDEEGELFDNTYLDELKGGSGRESLSLDEIQRRNSMVPPHLRSSYMPQFSDAGKANENMKSLDDSLFSNPNEVRRGPAYKRPGPPTPSKNGGRLSLGGSELPRSDVLREQNGSNGRPSLGGSSKGPKKNTPGKLSRLFSTSKIKDEDNANGRHTLQHIQRLFFSTSTPRRRPSLPKFETTGSFVIPNRRVSTVDAKFTANTHRLKSLSKNVVSQTKRISRKILWSADKKSMNSKNSTPEYDHVHRDSTKLVSTRKSVIKKRASLKKKALRHKIQKEKRHAAYNQARRISKVEHAGDETYSIDSGEKFTGATYSVADEDASDNESDNESDIQKFHAELNEYHGPIEIVVDNFDDEVDFEKLCNTKQSECPYEDKENIGISLRSYVFDVKCSSKSVREISPQPCCNVSPQSINSNFSSNSTKRMSSHCARLCWNQQKIPKITTYKAEKKSFDSDNQSASHSQHSIVTIGWQHLPPIVKYYLVGVTICLISIIYFQFLY